MTQDTPSFHHGVDYLFCPGCEKHVPCVRTVVEWEVQCPNCDGACGLCQCPLREACIGVARGTSRPYAVAQEDIPPCPWVPMH